MGTDNVTELFARERACIHLLPIGSFGGRRVIDVLTCLKALELALLDSFYLSTTHLVSIHMTSVRLRWTLTHKWEWRHRGIGYEVIRCVEVEQGCRNNPRGEIPQIVSQSWRKAGYILRWLFAQVHLLSGCRRAPENLECIRHTSAARLGAVMDWYGESPLHGWSRDFVRTYVDLLHSYEIALTGYQGFMVEVWSPNVNTRIIRHHPLWNKPLGLVHLKFRTWQRA